MVMQHVPAHTQNQPSVPLDEGGECGLVPMGRKLLEELTIRPPQAGLQRNQPANVSDDRMQFRFGHCFGSP
jgi:hypothetical protein